MLRAFGYRIGALAFFLTRFFFLSFTFVYEEVSDAVGVVRTG